MTVNIAVAAAQTDSQSIVRHGSPEAIALISQLREARKLDDQGVKDYNVDPVIAQDFAVQGEKADKVIKDLEIGEEVPRSEILDALLIPSNP